MCGVTAPLSGGKQNSKVNVHFVEYGRHFACIVLRFFIINCPDLLDKRVWKRQPFEIMSQNKVIRERAYDDEDLLDHERRLLLIGKTGSGKSTSGNMIFNDSVFESEISSSSVTRVSQTHSGSVNNRRVMVVDTPDFRFSTHTDFDSDSELKRALQLCAPGAHVILLFLSLSTFTEQELEFIHWFEQKFGDEALRFTLVLFTHADKRHRRPLGEMIRRNTQLSDFINRCGRRYHEFNIKAPANRRQVTELMEKVERLVSDNSYSCYTLEMMEEEEKRRKEEEKRREEEEKRREEEVRRKEEEKREDERRREREHQIEIERVKIETEICMKRDFEQSLQQEKKKILEEHMKAEKREKHPVLKDKKLNYMYVFIFFAIATGSVSVCKEDSFNKRMFLNGFFTGGLAASAGVFTGMLCRRLWKSPFVIRLFSHEHPRAVNRLLPKTLGVLCGTLIGHYVGGNVYPVSALTKAAGAVGAFTAIHG